MPVEPFHPAVHVLEEGLTSGNYLKPPNYHGFETVFHGSDPADENRAPFTGSFNFPTVSSSRNKQFSELF